MTLADLRRAAVRGNLRIRFRVSSGMDCVLTERGIAEVPGLSGTPDFNLEQELARAPQFVVESAAGGKAPPRQLTRDQMAALASSSAGAAPAADHDD